MSGNQFMWKIDRKEAPMKTISTKLVLVSSAVALAACSSQPETDEATPETVALEEQSENTAGVLAEAVPAPTPAPPAVIDGITNKRLSFAPGTSSATVEETITGYETVDYLLNVRAGQPMNISMATQHTATYFNVLEPGETDVAIHVGSIAGNQFEGIANKSGDYRIRVYMMRSAARRNERADYRLEAIVSP